MKNSEPKVVFVFVDLKKAFDRVPRGVIRFTLRWKGVPEYLVNGVMSLYKGCKTVASVDGGTIKFIFCQCWCPSRVYFESIFIYHGNGSSDRRWEGWFINWIGSAWKKFSELSGVLSDLGKAGFIFEATGEGLSVLC